MWYRTYASVALQYMWSYACTLVAVPYVGWSYYFALKNFHGSGTNWGKIALKNFHGSGTNWEIFSNKNCIKNFLIFKFHGSCTNWKRVLTF